MLLDTEMQHADFRLGHQRFRSGGRIAGETESNIRG